MKIKDNFSDKDSVLTIPASWFNTLARFYNYLTGEGCIIEKPANTSANNPPIIKILDIGSSSAVSLSDDDPLAPAATALEGTSTEASRSDHVHPLGSPVNPSLSITDLSVTPEGSSTANTSTFTYNGTTGVKIRLLSRVYYNDTATTPVLYGFYRDIIFDVKGRLYSVSAETRYVIDTPEEGVNPWDT